MHLSPETTKRIGQLSRPAFAELWSASGTDERLALTVARCRTDRRLFARAWFPDRFELDWSPVHRAFLEVEKTPWRERERQTHRASVAPRGAAKSSIVSYLDVAHDIVYGFEVCILLYSTGASLADDLVEDLHQLFTSPSEAPEFHAAYGPFEVSGTKTSFVVRCPGGERLGTQVEAKSLGAGSKTRGHKHAGQRPSKFVLDDTVNPKHVRNPEQRDAAWSFLLRDVLKAGARYSLFWLVGTIQHADDLVARVEKSPLWSAARWRNLVSWPVRMDLWERCRELWADLRDAGRVERALAFYAEHRSEMDRGAEVLWPAGRSLWDLMVSFWSEPAAFWSEDQNEPRDPTASLFDLGRVRRCRVGEKAITTSKGEVIELADCKIGIWLDPSSGGDTADYPAIAVVAHHSAPGRAVGNRYVVAVDMLRRTPTAQHEALWSHWDRYSAWHPAVGYDATGTQGLIGEAFERMSETRKRAGRPWQMPIRGYSLTEGKERIDRLEPALHNGWIEVADDVPGEAWEQIRDYPHGLHDDVPDAIERADWLATQGNRAAVLGVSRPR